MENVVTTKVPPPDPLTSQNIIEKEISIFFTIYGSFQGCIYNIHGWDSWTGWHYMNIIGPLKSKFSHSGGGGRSISAKSSQGWIFVLRFHSRPRIGQWESFSLSVSVFFDSIFIFVLHSQRGEFSMCLFPFPFLFLFYIFHRFCMSWNFLWTRWCI